MTAYDKTKPLYLSFVIAIFALHQLTRHPESKELRFYHHFSVELQFLGNPGVKRNALLGIAGYLCNLKSTLQTF